MIYVFPALELKHIQGKKYTFVGMNNWFNLVKNWLQNGN